MRYDSVKPMPQQPTPAPASPAGQRPPRLRRDPEVARRLILDAAERLMRDEGYAAVSTRRVAKEAGLAPALVHYYYPVTDDLFVALHARMTDRQSAELRTILAAPRPLHALWDYQTASPAAALGVEFMALANHRKALREPFARRTEQARAALATQMAATIDGLAASRLPPGVDPAAIAALLTGIARALTNETAVGIAGGHAGAKALVEWALAALEGRA